MLKLRAVMILAGVMAFCLGVTCSALGESSGTGVERLLGVAPDDVIGFVATSGGDELKPAFEQTIMAKLWGDKGVQQFVQAVKAGVRGKFESEVGAGNKEEVGLVLKVLKTVSRNALIVGAAERETPDFDEIPPFYGFAIIEGGRHRDELNSLIAEFESMAGAERIVDKNFGDLKMRAAGSEDFPVYWGWLGERLIIALNDAKGLALKNISGGRNKSTYLNKLPAHGDALAAMEHSTEDFRQIKAVLEDLGLAGISSFAGRMGFAGENVVSGSLLKMPPERKGIFVSLKPADIKMFDIVGEEIVSATAINCDAGGVYDTVMRAVTNAAPGDADEIKSEISEFEAQAGFKIRDGILSNLSGPMVFYNSPATMMSMAGGVVFIAGVKDGAALEKSLSACEKFLAAESDGMLQISTSVEDGKRTVHNWVLAPLAMIGFMPAWTVTDGYFVFGTTKVECDAAVDQIAAVGGGSDSLRSTAGFKEATANLPAGIVSLRYTNSERQFKSLMTAAQRFWPMVTMGVAHEGITLPVMLPDVSGIASQMDPAVSYAWLDGEGLHSYSKGPGVEANLRAVAGGSMAMAVMMPALARVRQLSQRMISGTHLSNIGKACIMYAADNDGAFPPGLEALVGTNYLKDKEVLESPSKPKSFSGPSYVYVAGQNRDSDAGNVLAYENPAFMREGVNVLFVDGHVTFMKPEKFLAALKETYEKLENEMPEVNFGSALGGCRAVEADSIPMP